MDDRLGSVEPYVGFALIYDKIMRSIDYDMWASYIENILQQFDYKPRTVLDVACGTGNSSFPFAARGYRVTGVDRSEWMIRIAIDKAKTLGLDVQFEVQDMRELSMKVKYDLAICLYDSMNYLLTAEDLYRAFRSIRKCIVPGGFFIFDMNSEYQLNQILSGTTFFEDEDSALVWEDSYNFREKIWQVCLTGFVKDGASGMYRKFKEVHKERAYSISEVASCLEKSSLKLQAAYNAFTLEPATEKTRRIYFVARAAC